MGTIVFTYGFIFLFFDPKRIALHDVKLQMIHICVALGLGTASLFKWGILVSFWLASFYQSQGVNNRWAEQVSDILSQWQ